ncbi:hypothetical protein BC332_16807 [Capsicum chinense]|nr:hypothetical protein BC332_16807 [Capsicum chinense]
MVTIGATKVDVSTFSLALADTMVPSKLHSSSTQPRSDKHNALSHQTIQAGDGEFYLGSAGVLLHFSIFHIFGIMVRLKVYRFWLSFFHNLDEVRMNLKDDFMVGVCQRYRCGGRSRGCVTTVGRSPKERKKATGGRRMERQRRGLADRLRRWRHHWWRYSPVENEKGGGWPSEQRLVSPGVGDGGAMEEKEEVTAKAVRRRWRPGDEDSERWGMIIGSVLEIFHRRIGIRFFPSSDRHWSFSIVGSAFGFSIMGLAFELLHRRFSISVSPSSNQHWIFSIVGMILELLYHRISIRDFPSSDRHWSFSIVGSALELLHRQISIWASSSSDQHWRFFIVTLELLHRRINIGVFPSSDRYLSFPIVGSTFDLLHRRISIELLYCRISIGLLHRRISIGASPLLDRHLSFSIVGSALGFSIVGSTFKLLHHWIGIGASPLSDQHLGFPIVG